MRFHVLVTDFDETLAVEGSVPAEAVEALGAFRKSGRRIILATGRIVEDLKQLIPDLRIVDAVVGENGAVLYDPASDSERTLAPSPPLEFIADVRARGVVPFAVGRVLVATRHPYESSVLDVIRDHGLDLTLTFNKGAVMALPAGVNKASGIAEQLAAWHIAWCSVAGIGDAENDLAFLSRCEAGAAVANALPSVAAHCDYVTSALHGAGVVEFIDRILADELQSVESIDRRRSVVLGLERDGREIRLPGVGCDVLLAGASGGGKSSLVTGFGERVGEAGYQYCVLDPEGDYDDLTGAIVLGDAKREPTLESLADAIINGDNVVVSLLSIALEDRPAFAQRVFARLHELRSRYGRPHWVFLDEAHHLLPEPAQFTPISDDAPAMFFVTTQPRFVSRHAFAKIDVVLAVGDEPGRTIEQAAQALESAVPEHLPREAVPKGDALVWRRSDPDRVTAMQVVSGKSEHRRHVRKYAEGELAEEKSFYFTGPHHRLHLRAQNLMTFVQIADGVDDETWRYHLRRHEFSRWMRDAIGDRDLSRTVAAVERDEHLPAAESRARVAAAIRERYTAPA